MVTQLWIRKAQINIIDILWCMLPIIGLISVFPQFIDYCRHRESFSNTLIEWNWLPQLGFTLQFLCNPESTVMMTLIFTVSIAVFIYTLGYTDPQDAKKSQLQILLLAFMISMVGLVTIDHLIGFYCFWECTSICSYFLIGYYSEDKKARVSAMQALIVTTMGGLILLADNRIFSAYSHKIKSKAKAMEQI